MPRLPLLALALTACSGAPQPKDTETPTDDTDDTGASGPSFCETYGFGREVAWDGEGPYGLLRHDLAEDFSLPLADGTTWTLSERWTGCESYIFVPDSLTRSSSDDRSIWVRDLDDLVEGSPRNAHYFFVSTQRDDADADANVADMVDRVEEVLGELEPEDATWWAERLHVVDGPAKDLDNWVESTILRGIGTEGFAVDRAQKVRGVGTFADVNRADSASGWFQTNLSYAAHEVRYFDMEAAREARLEQHEATIVPLWTGEVVEEYAEMDVELPSAEEMATFDTFEIDVDMRCPDPESAELGNCGAWDYLAYLWVQEEDGSWTELSRFITTYHREAHWVADATPMMAHLLAGGTRRFKWEWAPSWNTQPTETRLSLRFGDQGKGYKPRAVTLVATGGSFGSTYNDGREPVEVPVSPSAAKVELWALLTGHGMATNNCAEFCNHQHEFTVGSSTHRVEYEMAGTQDGCVAEVEDQMTPNQAGTWWYGRGGWCPGQVVEPFAADLTGDVANGAVTVSYRGLFQDGTPPDGAGDIVLNAWVVVYE